MHGGVRGRQVNGCPEDIDGNLLQALAQNGATILFADINFFTQHPQLLKQIAGEEATVRNVVGTIYHHDHIATDHPLFDGLSKAGALEFDKYGIVYPECIFQAVNKPSRTVCAANRVDGAFTVPGLSIGEYACGAGRYVLNNFRLCQCIGRHPFADKLLLNAIKHYGK